MAAKGRGAESDTTPNLLGKSFSATGGLVLIAALGLVRVGLRNAGNLADGARRGRGVDELPKAFRNLDPAPLADPIEQRRALAPKQWTFEKALTEAGVAAPSADSATEVNPQQGIHIKEVDTAGLAKDATDFAKDYKPDLPVGSLSLAQQGITVQMTTHSCRLEYEGTVGGDMTLVKKSSDEEMLIALRGRILDKTRKMDSELPQKEIGEFDHCRLRFGDDSRVFLAMHERTKHGDRFFEVRGTYELNFIEGSQEDYKAGRTVRLAFTPEGLRRLHHDVESQGRDMLKAVVTEMVTSDARTAHLKDRVRVEVAVEGYPEQIVAASRTTLVIQDLSSFTARAAVTLAPE